MNSSLVLGYNKYDLELASAWKAVYIRAKDLPRLDLATSGPLIREPTITIGHARTRTGPHRSWTVDTYPES